MVNHVTTDSVVNINVGGKTMAVIYLNDEDQDFLIFHMKLEADCGKEADAVIANPVSYTHLTLPTKA